ncbi:uncharacterized protein BXZ73DRAFT_78949 [Epithele typhae]|uniref:uncharacterized protein n=1 Tax=Epithele typhae TaxID=378194 RepID=UPI00200748FD|nr:uncharacterized protein BXZ73DRAFT_78949 [Epithele typhae]KAH9925609.1 hypothetical protein BXZ73DRAFT_78949 [Epithele typhae]
MYEVVVVLSGFEVYKSDCSYEVCDMAVVASLATWADAIALPVAVLVIIWCRTAAGNLWCKETWYFVYATFKRFIFSRCSSSVTITINVLSVITFVNGVGPWSRFLRSLVHVECDGGCATIAAGDSHAFNVLQTELDGHAICLTASIWDRLVMRLSYFATVATLLTNLTHPTMDTVYENKGEVGQSSMIGNASETSTAIFPSDTAIRPVNFRSSGGGHGSSHSSGDEVHLGNGHSVGHSTSGNTVATCRIAPGAMAMLTFGAVVVAIL